MGGLGAEVVDRDHLRGSVGLGGGHIGQVVTAVAVFQRGQIRAGLRGSFIIRVKLVDLIAAAVGSLDVARVNGGAHIVQQFGALGIVLFFRHNVRQLLF